MGESIDRFPLFPLALVLLPGEKLPLHIFEERYKLMIGECLEGEREFGVLWMSDDELKDTGCAARVDEVVERLEDGRMNIIVEGTTPFALDRRVNDLEYPAGDVTLLDDDLAEAADGPEGAAARSGYADLVERVTDERPDLDDLERLDAYGMAATLDFALDAKQELLELRSERRRLERLRELFASTLERIDAAEEIAEVARTNGRRPV